MIYSVLEQDRMPPWNAHADFDGVFVNERIFPDDEKTILMNWIRDGMSRGNPAEDPPKKSWSGLWRIGKPTKVFTMKESFAVPAEGVVEYQYFTIPTNFRKDKWFKAMEVRAGAADVVHHIIVFSVDPNSRNQSGGDLLSDGFLAASVPGDVPSIYAPGQAKKLSAGHSLVLQVHYTTNGKRRKDKSKVARIFTDDPVQSEVRTRGIGNFNFEIPAGDPNYEVRASHTFDVDTQLLSLYPHMHFRGKDWKYVAHFPDGSQKVLLSVPRYDYNWQESYILQEPILMPKGTKLECIAHYDNSSENFLNPDATKAVRYGDQSWEEMFFGFFDYIVLADG